jgi:hypothetical protein
MEVHVETLTTKRTCQKNQHFIYHFFRKCAVVELKLKIDGTPKIVHAYGTMVYTFIHNKGLKKSFK